MLLLPVITTLLLTLLHAAVAQAERWTTPLDPVVVVREFDFDAAAPFVAGTRRGVLLRADPGTRVLAPCAGRVTFAGRLPRLGSGVSLRCGRLVATEFGLERPEVGHRATVPAGAPVGRLGARGVLRLGARVAADRWGYRDPLPLLAAVQRAPAPLDAPAARRRRRRAAPPPRPAPTPVRAPARVRAAVPIAGWLGAAVAGTAAGLGTTLRLRARRRRSRRADAAAASH